jgi:hypothetical protein
MNQAQISTKPSLVLAPENALPVPARKAPGLSIFLLGAMLVLGAVAASHAQASEEQSIRQRVQDYLAAWNGEAKPATREHIGRFYLRTAELIVFENADGVNTVATGWTALRELGASSLQGLVAGYQRRHAKPTVQLHEGTAWVTLGGDSEKISGVNPLNEAAARVTQAWQYRDGAWVIVYEHIDTPSSPVVDTNI